MERRFDDRWPDENRHRVCHGRKQLKRTLRSYAFDWVDSGLAADGRFSLNLFIAFDLEYMGTHGDDYTCIDPALARRLDHVSFIGRPEFSAMKERLAKEQRVIAADEVDCAFGTGYAAMRNALLFETLRMRMDCLVFLDDDEYPMAVLEENGERRYSGDFRQHSTMLRNAHASQRHLDPAVVAEIHIGGMTDSGSLAFCPSDPVIHLGFHPSGEALARRVVAAVPPLRFIDRVIPRPPSLSIQEPPR